MQIKSRFPRSVLNEIKWKGHRLSKCKIHYINRGSPGDIAVIEGSKVKDINKRYLVLEGVPQETCIPYHRITKIEYDDKIIFEHF